MTAEELLALSPGDVIRFTGFYYMRLEDSRDFSFEGMFVDMETGKLIHASHLVRGENLFTSGQLAMTRYFANYQY
jgi:hypothetical protein